MGRRGLEGWSFLELHPVFYLFLFPHFSSDQNPFCHLFDLTGLVKRDPGSLAYEKIGICTQSYIYIYIIIL